MYFCSSMNYYLRFLRLISLDFHFLFLDHVPEGSYDGRAS